MKLFTEDVFFCFSCEVDGHEPLLFLVISGQSVRGAHFWSLQAAIRSAHWPFYSSGHFIPLAILSRWPLYPVGHARFDRLNRLKNWSLQLKHEAECVCLVMRPPWRRLGRSEVFSSHYELWERNSFLKCNQLLFVATAAFRQQAVSLPAWSCTIRNNAGRFSFWTIVWGD